LSCDKFMKFDPPMTSRAAQASPIATICGKHSNDTYTTMTAFYSSPSLLWQSVHVMLKRRS